MKIYFVCTGKKEEKEAIRQVKPGNILLSYFYWKRRSIKGFIDFIGYRPNIMLDSGAYSAFNMKVNINVLDYIQFIKENKGYINAYISLDVIGDSRVSHLFYRLMKVKELDPIPVFHYGESEDFFKIYNKCKTIALGNTVPVRNKKTVATWVNSLIAKNDSLNFHLLGSSSKHIITGCPKLYSLDSSTYVMMAVNGYPKEVKGKKNKIITNMLDTLEFTKTNGGEDDGD